MPPSVKGGTTFTTAGEQLLKRELEKETVQGVEHYRPGQYDAVTYGPTEDFFTGEPGEIARVTYVDLMGHACVVVCWRPPGGEWKATWVGRAGQTWQSEARKAPEGFELSKNVRSALRRARFEELPE